MSNCPEEDSKLDSRKKTAQKKNPEFYVIGDKLSEKFISLCFIIV